ncbi:hypothetical protein B0H14DRAFT_3460995 [Mycena olivaceomarginata]|nr:hypothetical protein B0H14DRAFT_3460995 [Mycena olivaceomarginata]
MDRNDEKLRVYAEKYVAAWEAKRRLVGDDKVQWRRLNPKTDLRCMEAEEDGALRNKRRVRGKKRSVGAAATEEEQRDGVREGERGPGHTSEGRRTLSWIWMGTDTSGEGTNKAILAGLRAEWAKAWARTRRWTEEVELLREEMRRVPITMRWKAQWWEDRSTVAEFNGYHAEGARAYALRQAELFQKLANHFETMWAGVAAGEEVESSAKTPVEPIDADEEDEEGDDWVAPESEGEGGLEGEDEEGSLGEEDDNEDDE